MKTQLERLDSQHCTLILGMQDAIPQVLYWGQRLAADLDLNELASLQQQPVHLGTLDHPVPLSLVPEPGRGFFGAAGLEGHSQQQHWAGQFQAEGLQKTGQRLDYQGRDAVSGLTLTLQLTLTADTDMLSLQASLHNAGTQAFELSHLGLSLPVPARADELMTFHGRWIQEFLSERKPWPKDRLVQENRRGRTSHDTFPGIVAGTPGFAETRGEVWGLHLAWSGNHRTLAEKTSLGERHLQMAEWLYPGEVSLAPGATYHSPRVMAAWSDQGLNGLSRVFHQHLRRYILAPQVSTHPRPVHFNTWEGIYFDHKPDQLLAMVEDAAAVGVERFVLDDGWFGERHDDTAGLGDWWVNERKHPGGLDYLIDAVKAAGMEFGLWFEPEMINADSDLYRAHPDWILSLPGYSQPTGRHQYVLDLSRHEVENWLFERLDTLLQRYDIRYIKWDMNRDLTQPGNARGHASVHAQTRALYRLLERLRQAHPAVEIESCASGGGRADFGILAYTQRIWVSDCIDALERQRMQKTFSIFFPPEVMGSHISANPTHTTGRHHSAGFRLITAMFGHMGLELDVTRLSSEEKTQTRELVARYKHHRQLLHSGHYVRLDTADPALQAQGVVADDGARAVFAAAVLSLPENMLLPPLRLAGLNSDTRYRLTLWVPPESAGPTARTSPLQAAGGGSFSGAALMQSGLQLPILHPETACLIELTATQP